MTLHAGVVLSPHPRRAALAGHAASEMAQTSASASERTARILVVEDSEASARLARVMLAKLGAACDVAPTGAQALARLGSALYDAVFMDCELPDVDGFDLTQRVRRGACGTDRERIPIYAFTAHDDDATRLRCAASGMTGFVSKPPRLPELGELLRLLGHVPPEPAHPAAGAAPRPPVGSVDRSTFDVEALLDRVAGDGTLAAELVESFLAQLPEHVRQMSESIATFGAAAPTGGDVDVKAECERIASLAHQLKGAVGGIGGNRLRTLASEIEAAGHACDVSALRSLGSALEAAERDLAGAVAAVDMARYRAELPGTDGPADVRSATPSVVLLAEDDPTLRKMLTRMLERAGHRVLAADSAAAARDLMSAVAADVVECVVSDYRMPGENGLDLIAAIRRADPSVASIVMTSDDEQRIVADSLRAGAFDFLQKPVDARRLRTAVDRAIERTREQRKLARVRSEVAAMGRTQAQMLETPGQCAVPVEFSFFPRLDAGGDFFSQFQLDEGRAIFLLTDVSGHDLQAAYLSAYFHGMTRGMLSRSASAREVFEFFNRFLVSEWNAAAERSSSIERQFASVAVSSLVIDLTRGQIESLTCGAPAPSRVLDDGRIHVVGERGGSPLGWFDTLSAVDCTTSTEGGGEILMWSDGLDDLAQGVGASVLSAAYLVRESRRTGTVHPLIAHAADDILLVSIQLGDPLPQEERFRPILMWRYRGNQAADIDDLVSYWRRSLRLALPSIDEATEHDVLLATREAMLNAMEHGCGGREDGIAKLQISYRASSRTLRVWVEDTGPGHSFDHAAHESSAADSLVMEHRGLIFIHHLASAVRYERNGASLMMDFVVREEPRPE